MPTVTADLFDVHPHAASCDIQFKSYGLRKSFAGSIRTVLCYHDNVRLKELLGTRSDGAVLVVDGGGSLHCALIGDLIAKLGMDNGWAGTIVHGAIRDSTTIETMDFGIKSLGTNPRKSDKRGVGSVDVPVTFGGVTFTPGHYLYSDADGILVAAAPLY